jgi:cytochrome P450
MTDIILVKLARLVVKDWTMKDGTLVPKGTIIFLNEKAVYDDEEIFDTPEVFNPWRMYQRRQREGEAQKHQWVMASPTHLHFGYSKHACPGRFFASNEIKVLLALLVMRYEIKALNIPGGLRQVREGHWGDNNRVPITNAKLEFKDRVSKIPADIRQYFG